ncbi:hypothetical protein Agabi119p4_8184 [Agaricus bisporus var. burnettii]|uniref:Uncharacterized protein n=1 Tax=Agaricus bisporus var. burnettii TaxID=192524 RepID=A0A8H7EY51_AGABI|nr:hypothetical protein Agabi119p4_8184 [Agaricus bisporus var. burnettii]
MIVSGLGTQDSPILLDDDSESEVVSELIDFPSSHLAHRDDSEFTLRLSPRPGTILSNKARLNLSQSSAQNLRKYRQDLRQHRKRKRVTTLSHVNGGSYLAGGQLDSASIIVDITVDGVNSETETKRPLLNQPKKISQSQAGPPTKRPKHSHKPNNEPIALPDRPPPATPQASSSTSIPNLSCAPGPTPRPDAPRLVPKQSRFSDSTTLPSSMTSTSYQFDPIPLSFPVASPDHFPSQFVSMMQEPFPVMNMDFDPMLWAMSISMNGLAASSTPIPPMGIPLPPKPTTSGKQQPKHSRPKSSVKPEPRPRIPPPKTSTKSDDIITENLPARPPHSNEGASISRQRPFTLRPTTDSSMTPPAYIPIGKPDFRDIHGDLSLPTLTEHLFWKTFRNVPALKFGYEAGA